MDARAPARAGQSHAADALVRRRARSRGRGTARGAGQARARRSAVDRRRSTRCGRRSLRLLRARLARHLSGPRRRVQLRRVHRDLSGRHVQRVHDVPRPPDSRVSDAGPAGADDAPAHADGRSRARPTTSTATSPWLPYMHVGTRLHNAIHTLCWQMKPADTPFLPADVAHGRPRQPRRQALSLSLAAVARADVARLHPSERRPHRRAAPDAAGRDRAAVRRSTCSSTRRTSTTSSTSTATSRPRSWASATSSPTRSRTTDRIGCACATSGTPTTTGSTAASSTTTPAIAASSASVHDGHFVGRDAVDGTEYAHIALREADYEPEKIQFYRLVDIPFARELRKVGAAPPILAPREARRQRQIGGLRSSATAAATSPLIRD